MTHEEREKVWLLDAFKTDLPLLLQYMEGLRRDDPMPAATLASDVDSAAAMKRLVGDASLGRVWLIQFDQTPVGYVALTYVHSIEFGGRCAFVDELYVMPEHRGRGIGKRTLELVIEESRSLNIRTLLLEVSPENERARRLYESLGFGQRKYNLLVQRISH